MSTTLSIVLWNVEYRRAGSADGRALRDAIAACAPDIACITEAAPDFLDLPHRIQSEADFGYPILGQRRKVLLWSRQPWEQVDVKGDPALPGGRYVCGVTETPLGRLRVHGVCIPWAQAHVATGRRDRRPWQEHLAYLAGLGRILRRPDDGIATIALGDFNQRVPRRRVPEPVSGALSDSLPGTMRLATSGRIPGVEAQAIDHLVHDAALEVVSLHGLKNRLADGREISDHFGLHLVLRRR